MEPHYEADYDEPVGDLIEESAEELVDDYDTMATTAADGQESLWPADPYSSPYYEEDGRDDDEDLSEQEDSEFLA